MKSHSRRIASFRRNTTTRPSCWFSIVLLLILCMCPEYTTAAGGGRSTGGDRKLNPYQILGLSKDATQDDIRRSYKKLCLQYHPDKNVNKSPKEKKRSEALFKEIQEANSQIGTAESRKRYDLMGEPHNPMSSPYHPQSSHRRSGASFQEADAFFRSFQRGAGNPFFTSSRSSGGQRPFYVNGIDITQLFHRGPSPFAAAGFAGGAPSPFSSVYVEKVKVPLEDLYAGKSNVEFDVHDNVWKRYRAAFRGGIAGPCALQSLGMCVPLLFRIRLPVTIGLFGIFFHSFLPRPTVLTYRTELQRGWKGGTKLKFKGVEPGFDVVFVLDEAQHPRFQRHGNDLHTTVSITKQQAKRGCKITIEPLSDLEMPIILRVKAKQIITSGQTVTIEGKGWPQRKNGEVIAGNLIVTVKILRGERPKKKTAKSTDCK